MKDSRNCPKCIQQMETYLFYNIHQISVKKGYVALEPRPATSSLMSSRWKLFAAVYRKGSGTLSIHSYKYMPAVSFWEKNFPKIHVSEVLFQASIDDRSGPHLLGAGILGSITFTPTYSKCGPTPQKRQDNEKSKANNPYAMYLIWKRRVMQQEMGCYSHDQALNMAQKFCPGGEAGQEKNTSKALSKGLTLFGTECQRSSSKKKLLKTVGTLVVNH